MRNPKRKTNRGVAREVLILAAGEVKRGSSIREAARSYNICHVTLHRFISLSQKLLEAGSHEIPTVGYRSPKLVFNKEQEKQLREYLQTAASMNYGLCPKEVRKLAYQCAVHFKCKHPESWKKAGMAGPDWMTGFLKRNPELSFWKPQATSLSWTSSFNAHNVAMFFNHLGIVYTRYGFEAKNVWNMDETGVTIVQSPEKALSSKGRKQVGALTSAETGNLLTLAAAVSAQGNSIPPFFIFPRNKFDPYFLREGPTGCVGAANGSGWMQEEEFIEFLRHFTHHTRPSQKSKILLVLENHASRVSIPALNFCEEHGIVLLTFPPHCSHKLQPLVRSVFGPFKRRMSTHFDSWVRNHSGENATIYDLPGIVSKALPEAFTEENIMAGFRCSGIWPYNRNVFGEDDLAPAYVTDGPQPSCAPSAASTLPSASNMPSAASCAPSVASSALTTSSPVPTDTLDFSPVAVWPHPKAGPRKSATKGRKRRVSAILTDTPVKQALAKEAEERKQKKLQPRAKRRILTKNKIKESTVQSSENCTCLVGTEDFLSSLPEEKWVNCEFCEGWACEECTEGHKFYICNECGGQNLL